MSLPGHAPVQIDRHMPRHWIVLGFTMSGSW